MNLDEFRERFTESVTESGCWIWKGGTNRGGYGNHHFRGSTKSAHRVAYLIAFGEIPDRMLVCHHCDVRSCVNPSHLFLGTQSDNMKDACKKGRAIAVKANHWVRARGERNRNAALTVAQVLAIRNDTRLQRVIAEDYGINQAAVSKIKRRATWRHVT